jgi:hypothetical protein
LHVNIERMKPNENLKKQIDTLPDRPGDRIITNLHSLKSHVLTAYGLGLKGQIR